MKTQSILRVVLSTAAVAVASMVAPAVAAPASEAQRVKAFLDARYLAGDVRHSFHTKFQESIDCVDYLAQPGAKALAAAGTPLTAVPSPEPRPATLPDYAFDGAADDQGNARSCPDGTVPLLRITADDIGKRGGMDAFLARRTKSRGPHIDPVHGATFAPDLANYAHVTSSYTGGLNLAGGYSIITVWSPSPIYSEVDNHSIGQTWLLGNGSNGTESVEQGWIVYNGLNGDNNPHFFVFSTNNNYGLGASGTGHGPQGCYNVSSACPTSCVGSSCEPAFVVQPGAWMTPGMQLSSGMDGSVHNFVNLETYYGSQGGVNGWVIVGAGFYASSWYSGSFQTTGTAFSAGGEVYDYTNTWVYPMGSGSAPYDGDANTASVSFMEVLPSGWTSWTTSSFSYPESTIADYGFVYSSGPINGSSSAGFYFGDNPKVWWGQDYGMAYSPVGDWDAGYNKGECGYGQPLIAISNTLTDGNSDAILCNENILPVTGGCDTRILDGSDNRGDTDGGWDWDRGYLKAECDSNEYVQGVSQSYSGSGYLHGILCCPSSQISHSSCQTQTFYSSDSPGESGLADWDPNFLKGHCPAGWFVEGASQGPSGGVHSLLCCH